MPLIFSYGTLQQDEVQLSTFGRLLPGRRDELPQFEPSLAPIQDSQLAASLGKTHHANVTFNGRSDSFVAGTVFEITDAELSAADEYERVAEYRRIHVTLASGRQAWVYVDASVTIRSAVAADAAVIASLMTQLGYPASAAEMATRLERLAGVRDYAVVVAERGSAIAGVAGVCLEYAIAADGPRGRVIALVVDESSRGLGIGTRLMRWAERWSAERGADRVTLTSGSHRAGSHAFYEALGYDATGIRFIKRL